MKAISIYEKTTSFLWQHLLLVISMYVMTLGVALCVKSNFGSSVISAIPFVMTLAGNIGDVPQLTIGQYTYLMNAMLVVFQILILRRMFEPVQLFQLAVGFVFGFLLDANMALLSWLSADSLITQTTVQLGGCLVLAVGISLEIRCSSVTMPGEGITVAVCRASRIPFAKAKIFVDITMVTCAIILGYIFFGTWQWNVVGPGTLIAMIFVGAAIKVIDPYMEWFSRLLHCSPAFQRHIYGLARYIYHCFRS